MSREILISRPDAEHIIDLLEAEAIPEYLVFAAALREEFGMSETDTTINLFE